MQRLGLCEELRSSGDQNRSISYPKVARRHHAEALKRRYFERHTIQHHAVCSKPRHLRLDTRLLPSRGGAARGGAAGSGSRYSVLGACRSMWGESREMSLRAKRERSQRRGDEGIHGRMRRTRKQDRPQHYVLPAVTSSCHGHGLTGCRKPYSIYQDEVPASVEFKARPTVLCVAV